MAGVDAEFELSHDALHGFQVATSPRESAQANGPSVQLVAAHKGWRTGRPQASHPTPNAPHALR